jgi:hypothetical protein
MRGWKVLGKEGLLVAAVVLGLGGCVAYGMPRSTPLKGQSAETMARDRVACEGIAKTEVRSGQPPHPAPRPSVGSTVTAPAGPWAARTPWLEKEVTRQRDAAFRACLESRGYRTEPAP